MCDLCVQVDREFDGKTALHHAAFSGHTDVIKTLLEFGADKDITVGILITSIHSTHEKTMHNSVQDSNGLTALHFCVFRYIHAYIVCYMYIYHIAGNFGSLVVYLCNKYLGSLRQYEKLPKAAANEVY